MLKTLAGVSAHSTAWGAAFEEVADLALWASPEFGARIERIWRWEDWPDAKGRDLGIDRVVRTIDQQLWAVQAKGYAPTSPVKYADIATFLAASSTGEFALRLLVASTDRIASNARAVIASQSVPVRVLDRSWLDALELHWPVDRVGLRTALDTARRGQGPAVAARTSGRHQLHLHQQTAVADVVMTFIAQAATQEADRRHDVRATLLMPCGTGKTLTCHAIAEQLDARQILVVVPSLGLLAQTMRAWQVQSQGRLSVIAVCSDMSVAAGYDEVTLDASEVLAKVTTDSAELAAFLTAPGRSDDSGKWPTVVFATYHSSPVVAAAQTAISARRSPGDSPAVAPHRFDLLVADEAHYLAGCPSPTFATSLDDNLIRASRRVFTTATPRMVSTALKDSAAADGLDHGLQSMDDPVVFGPVAHQLLFSTAITKELLTDYQVLVLGVDDERVAASIDARTLMELENARLRTDAATLAAAVAVNRVVSEHGATRLVSYHSRVAGAEAFSELLNALPKWLPPNLAPIPLWAAAVSGRMPTSRRRALLARLSEAGNLGGDCAGILANARCLSEGVDIPALDGVVFVDPRKSTIDIVQSVGRALRLSHNKTRGLIVIPVALQQDQSIDAAMASNAFKTVWDIVGALRDHDDTLADEIDSLRAQLGRRNTMPHDALRKIVLDLPSWVSSEFADAIRVQIVEHTSSSFDYMLGVMRAFIDREGHARVPVACIENDINLGRWVNKQRSRRDQLTAQRRTRLEAMPGWTWAAHDDAFAENLAALRSYVQREGHARVPQTYKAGSFNLGTWVNTQRQQKDQLNETRRAQLEALPGWTWNPLADAFAENLAALKSYAQREGNARVPQTHEENGFDLGKWVNKQRARRGKLDDERRAQLETVPGWTWNPLADGFAENLAALESYAQREGHARVPQTHKENGINLGAWVNKQRQRKDHLSGRQRAQLEAVPGWTWTPLTDALAANLAALQSYAQREGHARVPQTHKEDGINLGIWVADQRQRKDKLTDEWQAQLEAVPGWTWDPRTDTFAENLTALKSYAQREGHARVPKTHKEVGVNLGIWVSTQRQKKYKLTDAWRAQLEAVPGWTWDPFADAFDQTFADLLFYVQREGHAQVPQAHKENGINLGVWVATQRQKKDQLTNGRRAQLEALPGWVWDSRTETFPQNLAALQVYAKREGHARVPQTHQENGINLGTWVATQRKARYQLDDERRAQLEAVPGWTWDPFADAFNRSLAALRSYVQREGHARVPRAHKENGFNLGAWVVKQRRKSYAVDDQRRALLEAIPGWTWAR